MNIPQSIKPGDKVVVRIIQRTALFGDIKAEKSFIVKEWREQPPVPEKPADPAKPSTAP